MKSDDRLDEVNVLLLYSEVYQQQPTSAFVKTLLSRLNRVQVLNFMCALSSIMRNNAGIAMEQTWQIGFVKDLGPVPVSNRVIAMLTTSKRVLLHEVQVGLLARYALQYCEASTTVGNFPEIVLRFLLATNELFSRVQDRPASSSDPFVCASCAEIGPSTAALLTKGREQLLHTFPGAARMQTPVQVGNGAPTLLYRVNDHTTYESLRDRVSGVATGQS